ncbi:ribonuclease III [Sphingomonas alba]|uniref:Ribonuclease 3 n=1 Tax=Sphingomonas alba TaxID=2908208 RepID=A0ABT0RK80_9SPHN|nr:ribonuclease III [Sphingomonas alba]MCL6683000.1 ribonuclease III [Sphingomonas alba]
MSDFAAFIEKAMGRPAGDLALYERAVTHASVGKDSYDRLEFLGDRVLGLAVSKWIYERFPGEPEGQMSRRYNALVARETCAEVGRALGVPGQIKLGKQAREDRASDSDNVVGDVVEALIGALFLEAGFEAAEAFIRSAWGGYVDSQKRAPQHPKSALQELVADMSLAPPVYEVIGRAGPHHAPTFRVRVSVKNGGEAEGEAKSKQDAETAAAAALLEKLR